MRATTKATKKPATMTVVNDETGDYWVYTKDTRKLIRSGNWNEDAQNRAANEALKN